MKAKAAALCLFAVLSTSCGYALVGKGGAVDPTIRRLGVPVFRDLTGKPDLAQRLTAAVAQELLKRGRWEVVASGTDVDAVVDGELTSYTVTPVGFGDIGSGTTGSKRFSISLSAKVTYAKTGATQPIWATEGFTEKDDYDVGDDPGTYVDREEQTLERLVEAFARKLVSAMLEAF